MKRHFLLIALIAALGSVIQAGAADRNCTVAERAQADANYDEARCESCESRRRLAAHPRAVEALIVYSGQGWDRLSGVNEGTSMAIIANRYWTLLLLFAGAAVSYAAGFMVGFGLFIAVGAVFELAFWYRLFKRTRR
jgi:hypothetical protein